MSRTTMLLYLLLLSSLLPLVDATITIGDKHYQSMPAVFGKPFSIVGDYDKAHLQILDENPFLCQGPGLSSLNERNLKRHVAKGKNETKYIVPSDGLPGKSDEMRFLLMNDNYASYHVILYTVAVLVSRGACSFEEKARTAMTFDFVKYVIVYDDRARSALVPMSATDPDDITVGLLFVSYSTGIQMRRMLLAQPANVTEEGGPIITMDARSPPMPPTYDQTQQWMLAAMAGFFCFMSCFGCLLVGIQAGYIPANGRIVFGPTGIHALPSSRRLLTETQVRRLPHETYIKDDDEDHHHHAAGCAICIEEYQDGETLQVLPCSHKFHTDCIVPWLTERQASCPLCKHDITAEDILDEDEESRGATGWFWWGRSGRTVVPTTEEEADTVESSPGSPSQSPPASPLGTSADNEENVDVMVPVEST
jgi:hypothetical protein